MERLQYISHLLLNQRCRVLINLLILISFSFILNNNNYMFCMHNNNGNWNYQNYNYHDCLQASDQICQRFAVNDEKIAISNNRYAIQHIADRIAILESQQENYITNLETQISDLEARLNSIENGFFRQMETSTCFSQNNWNRVYRSIEDINVSRINLSSCSNLFNCYNIIGCLSFLGLLFILANNSAMLAH